MAVTFACPKGLIEVELSDDKINWGLKDVIVSWEGENFPSLINIAEREDDAEKKIISRLLGFNDMLSLRQSCLSSGCPS